MRDFTLKTYRLLLKTLVTKGYKFQTFAAYIENPAAKVVILRHDVDSLPWNSLKTAQIEHDLGIKGTYYFRIVPQSNNPGIIRQIAAIGHEIGYHYEDLALSRGNMEKAIKSFKKNLNYLWQFYPVKTVCMHGSPLSKYDNRKLWDQYDYRDFGVKGEPYYDINFNEVFYLTDTGRTWNGSNFSLRDKVKGDIQSIQQKIASTYSLIELIDSGSLPNKMLLTFHPQRWTDNSWLWTQELIFQNIKNTIKFFLVQK